MAAGMKGTPPGMADAIRGALAAVGQAEEVEAAALPELKKQEEVKEEQITSFGTGKRIRQNFICDPGYTPASECFCARFSPDDQYLAASFSNGAIHIYSAENGKQEFVLNSFDESAAVKPLPVTQLRWRPHSAQSKTKSVLISVNAESDGQICHWHIKSGKCLHTITERGNQLFCLDYFADGSQFATAGKDRLVRVYDEATKRQVLTLQGGDMKETAGHSNRVFSLKYHPQHANIILSGGWDNTVQVWDTRIGHSIRSLWNCYLCGDSVDFTSDGNQILTGSWRTEDALQLWDFGNGDATAAETVEWASPGSSESSCMLFAAQCSKDPASSMILAGGSKQNEAKFFMRPPEGRGVTPFAALVSLPKPVYTVDFSHNSRMAAIGTSDGQIRVVDIV